MVDTHAHLGLCEPGDAELVAGAREAGVRRVLTVGLDEGSNRGAIAAGQAHGEVYAAVGRHPSSAAGFDERAAADLEALASHERVAAIGETGLDYYRDAAGRDDQRAAFRAQIGIARRARLPLVVHVRNGEGEGGDAVADVFTMLVEAAEGVPVILHCFSAGPERVAVAAERGWYCSFAGNLTYPKADRLREASRLVPDDLLLVETDSPFLAPQAERGRPNQPAHVVEVARRLAAERGVAYGELERQLDANAARVLRW